MQNTLRLLRNRANLTIRDLARLTGLSAGTIHLIETKKRKYNEFHLVILSSFFDVTTEFLLGLSDSGIGVYFQSSDNEEDDHEFISFEELTHIEMKHKVSEAVIASKSEEKSSSIDSENDEAVSNKKTFVFRYVEAHKEDTNISKSVTNKLVKEICKLSVGQQEKVYKFIIEYLK